MKFARAAIVGRTRKGKTWLARALLERHPSWIVIDPDDEYGDLATIVLDEVRWDDAESIILDLWNDNRKPFRVVIIPEDPEDFERAADLAFRLGNVLFMCDEAHEYVTEYNVPKAFSRLVRRGMKRGCRVVLVSQRHVELNSRFLAQADLIVSFQQLHPRDLRFMREYATSDKHDLDAALKACGVGQCVVVSNGVAIEPNENP